MKCLRTNKGDENRFLKKNNICIQSADCFELIQILLKPVDMVLELRAEKYVRRRIVLTKDFTSKNSVFSKNCLFKHFN